MKLSASAPAELLKAIPIEVAAAPHKQNLEYKGFKYRVDSNGFIIMLNNNPLIMFADEASVFDFADRAYDAIEKYAMKDINLHLIGCMRCKKVTMGVLGKEPCMRGGTLFLIARKNADAVVKALVDAVQSPVEETQAEVT